MIKALLLLTVLTVASCEKQQYVDPFTALDRHISQAFAYHYMWPWGQLMKAAAAFEEDGFNEPKIISTEDKLEVRMNVKQFKPEELRIRVKNKNIIVEGKRKLNNDNRFMANHFVQRFILPPGSKQEEVSAVINENAELIVYVPKHDVPPPPPEREVPIEVLLPSKEEPKTEKPEPVENKTEKPKKETEFVKTTTELPATLQEIAEQRPTEKKQEGSIDSSSRTPLEQLELVEATTHAGKIRKKELKDTKVAKDNEVTKGLENNGLDYALLESSES